MDHLLRLRRSCCHFRDPLSWSLAHQHLAEEPWPANPPRSRRQSQLHHHRWIAATRRRCSGRCALKTCCRAAAICSSSASSFSSSLTCQSCLARACAHAGACAIREAKNGGAVSGQSGWGRLRLRKCTYFDAVNAARCCASKAAATASPSGPVGSGRRGASADSSSHSVWASPVAALE